ncbi:MAG TPA: hypothetical protein VME23_03105 [Terracidiphilus sp.]|nr:hypothetical protein [Terracidiphilus sp.]
MRKKVIIAWGAIALFAISTASVAAENVADQVKKAVEKCTLDQPGTKPFHLKAEYAPSYERDINSHRTGEIEIWWESPTRWRRELRSPEFHQVLIVDGSNQWQKNDGDYFPDWLRELALAIIRPIPIPMDVLLTRVKDGDVKQLRIPNRANGQLGFIQQTNVNWEAADGPGDAQETGNGGIALLGDPAMLFYTNGPGWGGLYHDFMDFHGRMVARTVASGYIEVKAKVDVLEDLGSTPAGFFDTSAPGGDANPINTVVLNETELRKNLLPANAFEWPTLEQGPLEGVVWTEVVVDRSGHIREMIPPIADNPGVKDAAEAGFRAMQFQPFVRDGVPVQVWGKLSVRFTTVRPAGMETFLSAKDYFERGRKASFLAEGGTAPYVLSAEFQTGTPDGPKTGRYQDTWISADEWKREAWLGSSHFLRSETEGKYYVVAEGPQANILRTILRIVEPIPATDTMTESDWRIKRDTVDGIKTIRVVRGSERPDGELDPSNSEGFWFDESGQLIKCSVSGLEILEKNIQPYGGVQVARSIDVKKGDQNAAVITVTGVGPADPSLAKTFKVKGHEWQRQFTAEVR